MRLRRTLVLGVSWLVLTAGGTALAQTNTESPATAVTTPSRASDDAAVAASPRSDAPPFSLFGLGATSWILLGAALIVGIPALVVATRTRRPTGTDNHASAAPLRDAPFIPAEPPKAVPAPSPFVAAPRSDFAATSPRAATAIGVPIGIRTVIAVIVAAAGLLGLALAIGVHVRRRR